jgi:hypothetical protein
MAWNLRPFLGDRNQPFRVIGHYQGNFYEAVIYAVKQLVTDSATTGAPDTSATGRSLEELLRLRDSTPGPEAQP